MDEEAENDLKSENEIAKEQKECYCGEVKESELEILRCTLCKRRLHLDCLRSGRPSPLVGDVYFEVTCSDCASDGEEKCKRVYMSWSQAVYLALYNLCIYSSGRKGYFRWKEDICQFLERNWMLLFPGRKRTTSWCSTVAGTLSIGCPHHYKSGTKEFKENGWWALADKVPPVVKLGSPGSERKRKKNSNKSSKKRKTQVELLDVREQNTKEEEEAKKEMNESNEETDDQLLESLLSGNPVNIDTQSDEVIGSLLSGQSLEELAKSPFPFMEMDDPCSLISDDIKEEWDGSQDDSHVGEGNNDSGNESDRAESVASTVKSEVKKLSKTRQNNEQDIAAENIENRLTKISEDDEHEVLCRLNACTETIQKDCKARRLRRKLILRKIKRENSLPLFDLDAFIKTSLSSTKCYVFRDGDFAPLKNDDADMDDTAEKQKEQDGYQQKNSRVFTRYSRVLDRFLAAPQMLRRKDQQASTFLSRLVGADRQTLLRPITSPYTARVLKPFIRRDFESRPLKLRLLEEIKAYPHRNDSSWKAPPSCSLDYCYVQPYHIPAVNTMCREFFWPGIDLSESLQYPDFSCVVLYRSLVIGFAFMVPDVKYNEAYISFILVHPEWRRAGIGTYMLYHLIQTCMGKDVTLHVSVTNQAMLMYQKFGFKPEEFILDFYEKYLPESSQECRHAFFLRLRR